MSPDSFFLNYFLVNGLDLTIFLSAEEALLTGAVEGVVPLDTFIGFLS